MDLEKEFDRVPRELVRWALRKLDVDEWFICTAMVLYTADACTVVRTDAGLNESIEGWFTSRVSTESTCLLLSWMFFSSEAKSGLPSELLYADDLVIIAPTMDQFGRWVAD